MEYTLLSNIFEDSKSYFNEELNINGWIRTIRDSKNFGFIELNDGTYFKNVQIVFDDSLSNFKEITKFTTGSSISIKGVLVATPSMKQPFEIKATKIVLEGLADSDYPLQKKRHTFEYLRTIAHLRPRTNTFSAVFRIRSIASFAIHKFFQDKGFVYVQTPIITGSDCEGAGEMFKVSTFDFKNIPINNNEEVDFEKDFFGKETNLTVSGQLEGETYCMAFRNIYTFGPTFRAENSNTTRHAAEFWMIEPEIAFADLYDDMELAEEMFKYIVKYCMENAKEEMEFFNKIIDKNLFNRLNNIMESKFKHIRYNEAIEILKESKENFEFPIEYGKDLQTEHERYLTEKHFKKPVFVIDYPKEIKSFYMRLNDDNKTVAAMDLLVPGVGEIIGGSQREERLDLLKERMREMDISEKDYQWYFDLRRFGGTKHAGFGLGFERIIMYITGMTNIRDVISFPRTVKYAEF
ncbi:MAG: asparagine--tRNA ligase [Clostridiales bacterium]